MKTGALVGVLLLSAWTGQSWAQSNPPAFNIQQTISDGAQRSTLAFSGVAMMTGNLEAQSFFPPGKVADYTGFQYLRDNDPDNMGHNTSFLTRVACNVIYILNTNQFNQLKELAVAQLDQINLYGYKRFPLMKAFRRLLEGDVPPGSAGLDPAAVKQASRELYLLDGQISFDRALLYANVINSFDTNQLAYLDAMKGHGWSSWPDITSDQIQSKVQGLPQGTAVAVMTYAGDLFSWYAGSLEADVYFCPERQGTYYGGFYIKDAPAIGHEGYSIDEQLTATAGAALCDSSKGYVTPQQAATISSLVNLQRNNLYAGVTNIVSVRSNIAALLRSLLISPASSNIVQTQVLALSGIYGDLDGENNYYYATIFAQVYATLTTVQKSNLFALRHDILTGIYTNDNTPFDFTVCTNYYLYSAVITDTNVLAPYIANTDYLFLNETDTPPFDVILGRPTDSSIAVNVLAATNLEAYCEYATTPCLYTGQSGLTNLTANVPGVLTLTGLQADTRYYYRLRYQLAGETNYSASVERTFHTQRAPGSTFTFCMHGDTHPERAGNMFNAGLYTNTLTLAAADAPDFYMIIGDDFSVDNIATNLINQALVTERYTLQRPWLGLVGNSAPLFLVNGNHEQACLANYLSTNLVAPGESSVTLSNIAVWAHTARNQYYSQPALDGTFYSGMTNDVLPDIGPLRTCFAWTWGDALFVTLDPYWYSTNAVDNQYGQDQHPTANKWDITHGDAQYQWLKTTLEQSTAKFKFVFAHHVMGGGRGGIEIADLYEWGGNNANGTWGFTANRPNWALPIHQLMATNHVTMFVQGHDHIFVREQLDGVTYLTLPIPADDGYHLYNADAFPNAIYKTNNSGYVRFTVSPAQVKVDYVRAYLPADEGPGKTNGMVDYSFTLSSLTNQPPVISAVTTTPATPVAGNPIWITASVTDDVAVASVTLNYRTGDEASVTNTVFLETMATNALKPWTGDGCDNAWTVTGSSFEQRTNSNYGAGNPCGLQFKQGTTNLTDNMLATTLDVDARGTSGALEFYVAPVDVTSNTAWTCQLNAGTGYVTRVSEQPATQHNYQLYHYDLQPSDLVSNLTLRFQFAGGSTNDRVNLDQISLKTVSGGSSWTNVTMYDDGLHGDGAADDGVYGAQIPAQAAGVTVSYYIAATDGVGATANHPAEGAGGALFLVVGTTPYDVLLGRPTDHSIAASLLSSNDLLAYVEYGGQPGVYTNQTATNSVVAGTPSVLALDALQPDSLYYYRLQHRMLGETSFSAGPERSFHTQRAPGSAFTFIIEADPHYLDNEPPVWQRALTNMLADNADFLIDLGDTFMGEKYYKTNSYTLSQAGIYEACKTVRNQFFSVAGHSLSLFLVNGNHDPELGWLLDNENPTSNSAVWGDQAREFYYPCPIPDSFFSGSTNADPYLGGGTRDGYYAFEWGDALFVMLDNFWYSWQGTSKSKDAWGWTLGTNQYQWLKQTLETSQAKFKFVFAHHLVGGGSEAEARGGLAYAPYFEWGGYNTNGTWGFTTNRPGWPLPIQSLLLSNGVNAFFHGHDHLFVKEDLDANGDGITDLVYQECPQPSRSIYNATNAAAGYGYTNGVIQGNSGYLRVQVTPTNATVDYVRVFLPSDEGMGKTNHMVSYSYSISAPISTNSLASTPNPSGTGSSVTFMSTVGPVFPNTGMPTGTVEFRTNGVLLGSATLTAGVATLATSSLPHGSNVVLATYPGDNKFMGSSNSLVQVVNVSPSVTNTPTYLCAPHCMLKINIANLLANNATDLDGDTLRLGSLVSPSTNGMTVWAAGNYIFYTNNAIAADRLDYTVSDGFYGGTANGTVLISINTNTCGQAIRVVVTNATGRISFAGVPTYPYDVQRATNVNFTGTLRVWPTNAPPKGLFEVVDDFSDLGGQPPAAWYRLRYAP